MHSDGEVSVAATEVFHHGLCYVMYGPWTCGRARWTNNEMGAEALHLEQCVGLDQAVHVTRLATSQSTTPPCLLVAKN